MTAEVERRMIERGKGGRVLNISSAIGIKPTVGLSAYCASKAAPQSVHADAGAGMGRAPDQRQRDLSRISPE